MKKLGLVLITLVLIAGFAFASGNAIELKTLVTKIIPAFNLYYKNANNTLIADSTVTLSQSIADENITANFEIWQTGQANGKTFSRYGDKTNGAPVELTITCGQFYYYGLSGAQADKDTSIGTTELTLSNAQNGTATTGVLTYYADTPSISGNTVTFKPVYWAKKVDDQKIGSFTAQWTAVSSLPIGVYIADITLSYTSPQ